VPRVYKRAMVGEYAALARVRGALVRSGRGVAVRSRDGFRYDVQHIQFFEPSEIVRCHSINRLHYSIEPHNEF